MESGKIKVFYFNNGSGGGVLSVIRNLLRYRQNEAIENHVIYTINKEQVTDFVFPGLPGAVTEQVFYYSRKWNFYHTCKKLSQLLPDARSVIVANDWLELGMISHLGLTNPVIQILHGDYTYYYDLAQTHEPWIDAYTTVAKVMADNLCKRLPGRCKDIHYLPFPVPGASSKCFSKDHKSLNVIFVGRLTKEKGYDLLPSIEKGLHNRGVKVKWHIVGRATEIEKLVWVDGDVKFYGELPNDNVIELMRQTDCLILPSLAEGMPVTLVEAMKVGLTCLVNDLPGGVRELIIDGVTGYKIEKNEVSLYVDRLEQLHNSRSCLKQIGEKASEKVLTHFEPIASTIRYEQLIEKCFHVMQKGKKAGRVYGSRLDRRWIPNFITNTVRSL